MLAHRHGNKRLDELLFAEAFEEEIWREAPKELNPFVAKQEHLRLFNKAGEPFALIESSPVLGTGRIGTSVKRQW